MIPPLGEADPMGCRHSWAASLKLTASPLVPNPCLCPPPPSSEPNVPIGSGGRGAPAGEHEVAPPKKRMSPTEKLLHSAVPVAQIDSSAVAIVETNSAMAAISVALTAVQAPEPAPEDFLDIGSPFS